MSQRGCPFLTAHFAMTTDGKISTRNFTPSLFTSPQDKAGIQEMRAGADAVLAGRGTVSADTMSLGLTRPDLRAERTRNGLPPAPLRVVVSNAGRLDPRWKIFARADSPPIIFSTARMPRPIRDAVAPLCDLHLFSGRKVGLRAVLKILRRDYGVRRVVCEGGGALLRALAEENLIDEIFLTIAPVVFGGKSAPTLTGLPGGFLPQARSFRIAGQRTCGDECRLRLLRKS